MRAIGALKLATVLCCIGAGVAMAQDLTVDLGEGPLLSTRTVQLMLIITVLSLAPGLAVTITCFPFIVTVLSILRQALGLQQSPPNMLLVSLSLFLTWFIMEPVMTEAWRLGIEPLNRGEMDAAQAVTAAMGGASSAPRS